MFSLIFSKILQLYTYTYTYTQRKCRIYDAFIDFRQKSGFIHIHIHIHIKTYVSFWIILLPISGRMHTEFSPKMPCCKLILNGHIFRIRAVRQRFDFFGGAAWRTRSVILPPIRIMSSWLTVRPKGSQPAPVTYPIETAAPESSGAFLPVIPGAVIAPARAWPYTDCAGADCRSRHIFAKNYNFRDAKSCVCVCVYTYTYTYTQRKSRIYAAFDAFQPKKRIIHIHIHIHTKKNTHLRCFHWFSAKFRLYTHTHNKIARIVLMRAILL